MSVYKIKMELYVNDNLDQLKSVAIALHGNANINNIVFMDELFESRLNLSEDVLFNLMSKRIPFKLHICWSYFRMQLLINVRHQILGIELIPQEPYNTKLDNIGLVKSVDLGIYIEALLALAENFLIRELYTEKLIKFAL